LAAAVAVLIGMVVEEDILEVWVEVVLVVSGPQVQEHLERQILVEVVVVDLILVVEVMLVHIQQPVVQVSSSSVTLHKY
jgi:hypothetical protein